MISFVLFFKGLLKKILIPWVQSTNMSHTSRGTSSSQASCWFIQSNPPTCSPCLATCILFNPIVLVTMEFSLSVHYCICVCVHGCENSSFYYLLHHPQREISLSVLCFSQVWIFSAPTIQLDTFLGLAISCGSGNIMMHLSTLLGWIKLIKLHCVFTKEDCCPAFLPLVLRGLKDGMWMRACKISH